MNQNLVLIIWNMNQNLVLIIWNMNTFFEYMIKKMNRLFLYATIILLIWGLIYIYLFVKSYHIHTQIKVMDLCSQLDSKQTTFIKEVTDLLYRYDIPFCMFRETMYDVFVNQSISSFAKECHFFIPLTLNSEKLMEKIEELAQSQIQSQEMTKENNSYKIKYRKHKKLVFLNEDNFRLNFFLMDLNADKVCFSNDQYEISIKDAVPFRLYNVDGLNLPGLKNCTEHFKQIFQTENWDRSFLVKTNYFGRELKTMNFIDRITYPFFFDQEKFDLTKTQKINCLRNQLKELDESNLKLYDFSK